jgi:hypothetical protein
MFTIVLRALKDDKKYIFRTQSDGSDVCKSPMGMFEQLEIDNDLKYVDTVVRNYYEIGGKEE